MSAPALKSSLIVDRAQPESAFNLQNALPPFRHIVWCHRQYGTLDDWCLARRNSEATISPHEDPSRDCYWEGLNESYGAYWSDVTVSEWAFVNLPATSECAALAAPAPEPVKTVSTMPDATRACLALDLNLCLEPSHKARAALIAQHVAEQVAIASAGLKAELEFFRQHGVTEAVIRRNGGAIKLGGGCVIVCEGEYVSTQQLEAEIARVRESLVDSLGAGGGDGRLRTDSAGPFSLDGQMHATAR